MYPFSVIKNIPLNVFQFSVINELRPSLINNVLFAGPSDLLPVVILVFCYSVFLNIRRADIFDFAVFALFLFMTLKASRHDAVLSLALGALTLRNLSSAGDNPLIDAGFAFLSKRRIELILIKILSASVYIIIFCGIFFYMQNFALAAGAKRVYDLKGNGTSVVLSSGVSGPLRPEGAVRFIKDNGINGNIFNSFNNAAYLIFGLYPDCRVFIDARSELYGDALLMSYVRIMREPAILDRIRANLGIGLVVLPCNDWRSAGMFKYLYNSKDWALVFFDGHSSVFLLKSAGHDTIIKRNRIRLEEFEINPDTKLVEQAKRKGYYPESYVNAARFFCLTGFYNKALDALGLAQYICPHDPLTRCLKGVALDSLDMPGPALEAMLESIRLNPKDALTLQNIGIYFLKRNNLRLAERYLRLGLRADPDSEGIRKCLEAIRQSMPL